MYPGRFFTYTATCLIALALQALGAESTARVVSRQPAPGTLDRSLANEVDAAVNRGLAWLASRQRDNGAWSNDQFPALTALAVRAFIGSGHPDAREAVERGTAFILSCVQPDGGIYRVVPGRKGGGLSNYNTAICMTTLHAVGRPDLVAVVQKARAFVADAQHLGDDEYRGGFGYDRSTGRAYTDLLNTYHATQAMRLTQDVEDRRPAGEAPVDIDWEEAAQFITRMQNKPAAGAEDAGGFFYNPTDPKAGTATNAAGVVVFRSYGSITYAGLLALVYADVSRHDPRVRSAFDWSARHWSLDENPGMGEQGLYFFYNVLARSLDAYGQDLIPAEAGPVDWRRACARRMVSLQKTDPDTGGGYWQNTSGRFWESDPVLATAYVLNALRHVR